MAADNGRFDDAAAMLNRGSLCEFLPAKQLAEAVAGKIVARAKERFSRGDSSAGWEDLAVADRLGGQAEAIGEARGAYSSRATAEIHRFLAAGQAAAALARLKKLERRGLAGDQVRRDREIAQLMLDAERAAAHGHFAAARTALGRAKRLASDGRAVAKNRAGEATMDVQKQLDERDEEAAVREAEIQKLATDLHTALGSEDWNAALAAAEAVLAIAPRHQAALQARRRAWKAVGMDVTQPYRGPQTSRDVALAIAGQQARTSTRRVIRTSEVDTVLGNERPERRILWIDAVGGFLVCLDDQIVLGQPSAGQPIAMPILADLSRRHAVIRREAGAYVLDPVQPVVVDGKPLTGPTVLADGQLIQLGESVRVRFRKPHALSATARLDVESHHKTQPSVDAVLLMADSCVMGPHAHCHVVCRDWQHDVVLYRKEDGFACRSTAPLLLDGEEHSGPVRVEPHARVEGSDFSFAWEMVE